MFSSFVFAPPFPLEMSAVAKAEATPCAVESKLWRECLKQYDYGPDRPKGACESHRTQFYACMKTWTMETQQKPYSYTQFQLPQSCGHEAEKLHECMMMNMFEVSHCQRDMTLLKRCAAQHDPEARKYLEGDPAIANLAKSADNATGWRYLWYRAIGKV